MLYLFVHYIIFLCILLLSYDFSFTRCRFLFDLFFFFSSRRRHTRCLSDWSSDVCSSDLGQHQLARDIDGFACARGRDRRQHCRDAVLPDRDVVGAVEALGRVDDAAAAEYQEIGRASCRERGELSVAAGREKKKKASLRTS